MNQKEFKVGDKVRIIPVWDGLPREGTGVIMHITPPGVETPEHVVVAAYGEAYRPSLCRRIRVALYFVRRDNPRDVDNPYLITCSTLPLELIDAIASGHNPDNLTVDQVGDGWWLPEWEVLEKISGDQKNAHFEIWFPNDPDHWSVFMTGGPTSKTCTYRTRIPRAELMALIAPKKRLIRVEELPPVCWVKDPSSDFVWMIHGRSEDSCRIYIGGMIKRIRELKDDWQWSTDLKTWNSFEVEDK